MVRIDGGGVGKLAGAAARAGTDWFDGGDLPHFHGTGGSSGDLLTTGLCNIQREKGRVSVVKLWHHATRHRGENRVEQRGGRVRP